MAIKDPRLAHGLVARETGFQPGKNGNFDISLFKMKDGHYVIEIFLKLQFFFVDGDKSASGWKSKKSYKWTTTEKTSFMKSWHKTIKKYWTKVHAGTLKNGKDVCVDVAFFIQEAGWLWDHFEIDITKIPKGQFKGSSVGRSTFSADVNLDSQDLTPKASGQLAAIHEFGHMIGLPDEYKSSSAHYSDTNSIMNSGTRLRPRHFAHLISWANKKLK